MANSADDSFEDLFKEGSLILDSPKRVSLLVAGKTSTTPVQGAALAAAVDGGNGEVMCNSTPSQGLHVSSMKVERKVFL